jgi:zinc protease
VSAAAPGGIVHARRRLACVAWAVVLAAAPAAAAAQEVEELEAGGIPVVLKRIEANEVIAVQLFLRGGAALLTPENAGIDRFLLSAALRGTEKYPKDVFHARLAATGTAIGATTAHDYSVFAMQTVVESWDEGWDLWTQALFHPTLPPQEVELVREQLLNAVRQRRDDPDEYVRLISDSLFYAGHPYAVDPLGTERGLEAVTRDALRDWHARRLVKDDLLLVVVGNVERSDLEARVAAAFGGLPERTEPAAPLPAAEPGAAAVAVVQRTLPTNYVRGYFAAPALDREEDYAALTVAMEILQHRLFEEVRTKRNLSYSVASVLSTRRSNYGLLYVTAVEPDTTLRVMLAEVRRLQDETVDDGTLEQAASVFVTEYYSALQSNASQAAMLGQFEVVGGGWEEAEDFVDEVRAVTPEEVQRVMRAYVHDLHFAVLGDPAKVDRALFTSM